MTLRRSARLQAQASACANLQHQKDGFIINHEHGNDNNNSSTDRPSNSRKRQTTSPDNKSRKKKISSKNMEFLPRTLENELKTNHPHIRHVIGIDEAGRGPLAGPVVAAAALVPVDLPGVVDSKKILSEQAREELYEQLTQCPDVSWAVAVVDAEKIDKINILQATMTAMRMAAEGLVSKTTTKQAQDIISANRSGCYVVVGGENRANATATPQKKSSQSKISSETAFALVDGNRVPEDMPCEAKCVIKGDSLEYSIAAASILAKVTRDRLMHEYDKMFPDYDLSQNKGYPTAAHKAAVRKFGASPIHRKTFAPLKHMEFDESGAVVSTEDEAT